MIDKVGVKDGLEEFDVSCDHINCQEIKRYVVQGWNELLAKMREDEWSSTKAEGEWQHFCWAHS